MAGIYIHIPFCRQKCHYCNFYSVASHKMQEGFIPALLHEIVLQKGYLANEEIETIYFGGGTPSLINALEIDGILQQIQRHYKIAKNPEITLEANPDDISTEIVKQWKATGINRLSLGVQSFHDEDLKYLFRTHDASKARSAIESIQTAGISNLSIDLIYGIPNLTTEKWKANLEQVIKYDIPHLSAYWLTVEEGTALKTLIARNKLAVPDDEEGIQQFQILQEWAVANGFIHYEISNLGQEGYFSQHNQSYWKRKKYLGLGPSAHSFNGDSRQWNVSSLSTYKDELKENRIPFQVEDLSPLIHYEELIMTGLRTMWGVDVCTIESLFGDRIKQLCLKLAEKYISDGTLILVNDHLKLSNSAYLISDHIIADLFIGKEEWEV